MLAQWTTTREDARPGRGEDRVEVIPLKGRTVVVVADGAGGVAGGAVFIDGLARNLTAEQVRKPLLGEGMALPVGFETQVKECSLLVATDGLWKYLDRTRRNLTSSARREFPTLGRFSSE
jgi:serine/threonine protein phosphatase PrpC